MIGLNIFIGDDNNCISFGNKVTVNASKNKPTVINACGGKTILIGDGSLFSNNIEVHTTDYHGIYDKNGCRINPDKDIFIGKKVWVGLGTKILKGTSIPDGCIIGAGSLLSKSFAEENVVLAGSPASILRREVHWDSQRKEHIDVPKILPKNQ